MARILSNQRALCLPLSAIAILTLLASKAHAQLDTQYDPDWARHFRVGALAGFNIKADFKFTGKIKVAGNGDGIYDDGYVISNPNVTADDYTSNWGYDDASQFDGDHTLTMHRTDSFSPTSSKSVQEDNELAHIGLDLVYGGNIWYWKHLRIGWDLGFGLLPIVITDNQSFDATLSRSFDTFDTEPGVPFFPPPGYRGNPNSDGRAIHSNPSSSGVDPTTTVETVSGSRTLDLMLYSLRLGPSVFWDVNQHIGLSLGAGPAVALVSGKYEWNEQIGDNTRNKGHFDVSDVLYGGYIEATMTYHAVRNGDFYISAQYMPLGTANFSHGGREATLDMKGSVLLAGGINWPF